MKSDNYRYAVPAGSFLHRLQVIAAQVNRAIEGRKTRTDPSTWYAIHQGLTGDDANERERWADANLVQFQGQLSDDDFAALTSLQATMRSDSVRIVFPAACSSVPYHSRLWLSFARPFELISRKLDERTMRKRLAFISAAIAALSANSHAFDLGLNTHSAGSAAYNDQVAAVMKQRNLKTSRMDLMVSGDVTAFRDQVQKIRANGGSVEVALQVNHDVAVLQLQPLRRLGQPVGARNMVGARHERRVAGGAHRRRDALVVGGHMHRRRPALRRALAHPHHHRPAAEVGQRLAGKAARRVTRRNYYVELHATSSSGGSLRTSSSSITGMPSFTG